MKQIKEVHEVLLLICSCFSFVLHIYICIDICMEDIRDGVSFKVQWLKEELVMPCHMYFIVCIFFILVALAGKTLLQLYYIHKAMMDFKWHSFSNSIKQHSLSNSNFGKTPQLQIFQTNHNKFKSTSIRTHSENIIMCYKYVDQ